MQEEPTIESRIAANHTAVATMEDAADSRLDAESLFRRHAAQPSPRTRERLVALHLNLVRFLAGKFASRGEPIEDLIQVGTIGLINAVDRFDPNRGIKFSTYATPTIVGEIRRYFRDKAWSVKVPRRLQELSITSARAREALTTELGRSPTIPELAKRVNSTEEEVLQAIEIGAAYDTISLDSQASHDSESSGGTLAEVIGDLDPDLERISAHGDLESALTCLDHRELAVITNRFFNERSQADVAELLNISQMHVSRLQKQALKKLKHAIERES